MQLVILALLSLAGAWMLACGSARLSTWTIATGSCLLLGTLITGLSWSIGLC